VAEEAAARSDRAAKATRTGPDALDFAIGLTAQPPQGRYPHADAADGGVTYDGTINLIHGTGRYRHLKATGTLKGFSPDAVRTTINEELTVRRR
jgi:hypothetical protein